MAAFKESLTLSRQKLELVYSIFLLIIIPLLVAANTLLITRSVRSDFDIELRRKADLANQIFGESIADRLNDEDIGFVQNTINSILETRQEIDDIRVSVPISDGYEIIASADESLVGQTDDNLQLELVDDRNKSVARLINAKSNAIHRAWSVVSPINDADGNIIAVSSMDVLLNDADSLIASTLSRSFFILLGTTVVIILLLTNHFKFVEYAHLFRKLKEVDQLKNDFLNVATHELKAPMAIIQGHIGNIVDGVHGQVGDKVKTALTEMLGQTNRLTRLVEDLLNVSRIEQGRISFDIQSIKPDETIRLIISQYEDKAKQKNITINYDEANLIDIKVDPGRFQEIMTNLIDNAIKYSEKGSVSISHKIDNKMFAVTVRDTGVGISAEDRKHLFKRFARIQNESTKGVPGTGLGLWIIRQYVEKMGGTIDVDSLEGEGTAFTVRLPKNNV